ncbi:hypothetical protein V8G54_020021 [Vigna mungo]|uniref:Transmembrane protein n=1 Tax=Vigna mungo TaxID=3915 RepID=A0AAQ3NAX9_VIGMU
MLDLELSEEEKSSRSVNLGFLWWSRGFCSSWSGKGAIQRRALLLPFSRTRSLKGDEGVTEARRRQFIVLLPFVLIRGASFLSPPFFSDFLLGSVGISCYCIAVLKLGFLGYSLDFLCRFFIIGVELGF